MRGCMQKIIAFLESTGSVTPDKIIYLRMQSIYSPIYRQAVRITYAHQAKCAENGTYSVFFSFSLGRFFFQGTELLFVPKFLY